DAPRSMRRTPDRRRREPACTPQPDPCERPPAHHPEPPRAVEDDPRTARQYEQREHEANERRIDAEALRDARTDAGDDAVVVAPAESCERHRDHRTARSTSTCPIPTDVSSSRSACSGPTSTRTLWPLSSWPRSVASPQVTWLFARTVASRGTVTRTSPIPASTWMRVVPGGSVTCERSRSTVPMPTW